MIPRNRDRAGERFTIQTGIGCLSGEVAVRPHIQHPGGRLLAARKGASAGRACVSFHLGIGKDRPVREGHGDGAVRGGVDDLQQNRYSLADEHPGFIHLDGKQGFVDVAAGRGLVVRVQHREAESGCGGSGFGGSFGYLFGCGRFRRNHRLAVGGRLGCLRCSGRPRRLRGQCRAAAGQQAQPRQQRGGQPAPAFSFDFAIHRQSPFGMKTKKSPPHGWQSNHAAGAGQGMGLFFIWIDRCVFAVPVAAAFLWLLRLPAIRRPGQTRPPGTPAKPSASMWNWAAAPSRNRARS